MSLENGLDTTQASSLTEKATPEAGTPVSDPRSPLESELERRASMEDARSVVSEDMPPGEEDKLPPAKVYHPLSPHVIALLMPASIFGALARLGLLAVTTYDGREIFPLAWVQAAGCFVMGKWGGREIFLCEKTRRISMLASFSFDWEALLLRYLSFFSSFPPSVSVTTQKITSLLVLFFVFDLFLHPPLRNIHNPLFSIYPKHDTFP